MSVTYCGYLAGASAGLTICGVGGGGGWGVGAGNKCLGALAECVKDEDQDP